MEDIKPCFGDIRPDYLGDIKLFPTVDIKPTYGEMKSSYGDVKTYTEDIKPFAVPISIVPSQHHHQAHHYTIQHQDPSQENSLPSGPMQPSPLMSASNNKKLVLGPVPKSKTKSKKSKDPNSSTASSSGEPKGRRPMNAFLLFAKDKRPELIQQYPGKDNR